MTCLIKFTTTSVACLVNSIPWLMLLLRHASNKKQQEKTTDPTACGSFSCGSNQTYFTPSVAPARDRHTCGRQENKSNMSFDANAQPWLDPSVTSIVKPTLELKCACDLVQSPGPPGLKLARNGISRVFRVFLGNSCVLKAMLYLEGNDAFLYIEKFF